MYSHTTMTSPIGTLTLIATDKGICDVLFPKSRSPRLALSKASDRHPVLKQAAKELAEYFAGSRRKFDVKVDIQDGTAFQRSAWKALSKIPYGRTLSYREQAVSIGDAKKARPIGQANGKNPVSIIVPCHRVIGASGKLTGYGGGISIKDYLLKLEQSLGSKKAA